MAELAPTSRTRLKRKRERGTYDRATINAILDEAFVCHIGINTEGQPTMIPTVYARAGDRLYLHGSNGNRVLRAICNGAEVCFCVTLVDGLVLARSAFRHSVNYRSVIVYGTGEEVTDPAEKVDALRAILDHVVPDRWTEVRAPTQDELRETLVVSLPIVEASAKTRSGPPVDDEADYGRGCWAGVIPLAVTRQAPVDDPKMAENGGKPEQ
jgi:nitroimidazol reductase NimA-like FMN-containing flavoprotein (pyridoxamine 5'-phosphate oxidase superfamily)